MLRSYIINGTCPVLGFRFYARLLWGLGFRKLRLGDSGLWGLRRLEVWGSVMIILGDPEFFQNPVVHRKMPQFINRILRQ